MSPEMLKGEYHDLRLDLYSMGVLMYEMLTGLPPHYSREVDDMYKSILDDPVTYPLYVSRNAQDLMDKLLMKDVNERIQTIEEVKQHDFFADVDWDAYYHKKVEPLWKPDLVQS